jgi:hypothetical protein
MNKYFQDPHPERLLIDDLIVGQSYIRNNEYGFPREQKFKVLCICNNQDYFCVEIVDVLPCRKQKIILKAFRPKDQGLKEYNGGYLNNRRWITRLNHG